MYITPSGILHKQLQVVESEDTWKMYMAKVLPDQLKETISNPDLDETTKKKMPIVMNLIESLNTPDVWRMVEI
jgi:hypothetical protein